MHPTTMRLLSGIRDAIDELERNGLPAPSAVLVDPLRLALNELMLRENRAFFLDHYRQGGELARRGAALAAEQGVGAGSGWAPPLAADRLAAADAATLDEARVAVSERLAGLVRALVPVEDGQAGVKAFLADVIDWENGLYAYRVSQAERPVAGERGDEGRFTAEAIGAYLAQRFPERGAVAIDNLRRLSGGFSKTTVLFDAAFGDGGRESLVIRADPRDKLLFLDAAHVENELPLLRLVHAAGHPVAEPLWLEEDETRLGRRFLVTRKGPGHNVGTRVDMKTQFTEQLLGEFIERLVAIHDTPVSPADPNVAGTHLARLASLGGLRAIVAAQVDQWRDGIARFGLGPSPLRDRTIEWLARNVPDCDEPPALLHGDYGLHNILIEEDRISCILDWEGASLGDPADELAWLTDGLRAQIEPQVIVGLYEEISGRCITPDRLRYFEVFNGLRFIVTCMRALDLFQADPGMGIGSLDLGLRFTLFGTGKLNAAIAAAEALKR